MHEFGMIQSIFTMVEDVAAKNNLKSISKVTIKVGKLRQLVPEFLQFAFETIAEDTIAANAKLVVEMIPIKIRCTECKEIFCVERSMYVCPKCQGTKLEVLTGKEILIESIEGEN